MVALHLIAGFAGSAIGVTASVAMGWGWIVAFVGYVVGGATGMLLTIGFLATHRPREHASLHDPGD